MTNIKTSNKLVNATIEQRLATIKGGSTLELGVEERFVNLRIWTGCNKNGKYRPNEHTEVFMRLDKANNYSVPLSEKIYYYIDDKNKVIEKLLKFGFISPISNLPEILEITKQLSYRQCVAW
jgi:hypothetical protein